ncbi:MAG: hypothetical protein KF744_17175 [Taibaiella sp.]|nr:hypothetical protein [Taibaiella sp.]
MKKIVPVILVAVMAFVVTSAAACTFIFGKGKKKTRGAKGLTSVGIHHTVCFGKCPDYRIEVDRDGNVTYTSMRFCDDTGIFKKNVGKAKVKSIFALCEKYRIDTCREMYENQIPDLPGLNFTLKSGKKKQMIFNASFGPMFLQEIAAEIDAVGKKTDNTWKKVGMPKLD